MLSCSFVFNFLRITKNQTCVLLFLLKSTKKQKNIKENTKEKEAKRAYRRRETIMYVLFISTMIIDMIGKFNMYY